MTRDMYGSAPDKAAVAVLLVDVINDFEFDDGPTLLDRARRVLEPLTSLVQRARRLGVPVIYVNDNFARWRSSFAEQVDRCTREDCDARSFVGPLVPESDDYFVLKPAHSGFYATPLDLLLRQLGVRHLVLCGLTSDICVLHTAHDAYMRGYRLHVPEDGCAAVCDAHQQEAMARVRRVLKGRTPRCADVDLKVLNRDVGRTN